MEMLKKRAAARGQAGFTLIELLVVIAILAILAGVVVFAVGNSTDNAKVAACKTEYAAVKTAIAAAETANETNTPASAENPTNYAENTGAKYFHWAGVTDAWYVISKDVKITVTDDATQACSVFQ